MNNRVEIMEVGLRDGLQNVDQHISVDDRLTIIDGLIDSGIKNIQVASFVNPKKVPHVLLHQKFEKLHIILRCKLVHKIQAAKQLIMPPVPHALFGLIH